MITNLSDPKPQYSLRQQVGIFLGLTVCVFVFWYAMRGESYDKSLHDLPSKLIKFDDLCNLYEANEVRANAWYLNQRIGTLAKVTAINGSSGDDLTLKLRHPDLLTPNVIAELEASEFRRVANLKLGDNVFLICTLRRHAKIISMTRCVFGSLPESYDLAAPWPRE